VLNQVLVSFGSPEETRRVVAGIQSDGTCCSGGTEWQGHTAMRISVSCWATTDEPAVTLKKVPQAENLFRGAAGNVHS
jgi:hypothetical protein